MKYLKKMVKSPIPIRSILLLIPEEGLLLEAAGVADIFHRANQLVAEDSAVPRYQTTVATSLRHRVVQGRSGLSLLADVSLTELDPSTPWDTIIVTGGGASENEKAAVSDWLRWAATRARRVVSICTGAFLLAQAGLLDGRKATTHWKAQHDLERGFPKVEVQKDPIFVRDGPIWTSAGASSGFDLALALVEDDLGFKVAKEVAQYLVLFLRRPGGQSQFSRFLSSQAVESGPIRDVQVWALENLSADLAVEKMADRAAMSPRNFARVFARQTGTTPAKFVEEVRLEAARQRLEQGNETLEQVASVCGLGNALNLRRLFEKNLGVSPSEYRTHFGRY